MCQKNLTRKAKQEEALYNGRYVFVLFPTGYGESIFYQVPNFPSKHTLLVVLFVCARCVFRNGEHEILRAKAGTRC